MVNLPRCSEQRIHKDNWLIWFSDPFLVDLFLLFGSVSSVLIPWKTAKGKTYKILKHPSILAIIKNKATFLQVNVTELVSCEMVEPVSPRANRGVTLHCRLYTRGVPLYARSHLACKDPANFGLINFQKLKAKNCCKLTIWLLYTYWFVRISNYFCLLFRILF